MLYFILNIWCFESRSCHMYSKTRNTVAFFNPVKQFKGSWIMLHTKFINYYWLGFQALFNWDHFTSDHYFVKLLGSKMLIGFPYNILLHVYQCNAWLCVKVLFQSDYYNRYFSLMQGRDVHGRIYLNQQGINAQVGLFVTISLFLPLCFLLWALLLFNQKFEYHGSTRYFYSIFSWELKTLIV